MTVDTFRFVLTAISVGALAVLLPAAILFSRDNVKARRQEIIRQLEVFFEETPTSGTWNVLPSFEFVKTKYLLGKDAAHRAREFELRWFSMAVLVFVLVSMLGFVTAFVVASTGCFLNPVRECLVSSTPLDLPLFLGAGDDSPAQSRMALSVVAFAFLGSYIASIRTLLRSVANFDLSPLTFFRCSASMLLAIFAAVALWRGMPAFPDAARMPSTGWLLFAFALGLDPGLPERMVRSLWRYGMIKRINVAATDRSHIVPLELIDGIDGDIRARLEDFNLYDVQNLATANPILLFVETPFGIYQSIDWVAQAQLATAVGVDPFLRLRELGVRTIFDLETALVGSNDEGLLESRVAAVLLPAEAASGETGQSERIAAARRMAFIMIDDLATRRLRQIWHVIEKRLEKFGPAQPPAAGQSQPAPASLASRVRAACISSRPAKAFM